VDLVSEIQTTQKINILFVNHFSGQMVHIVLWFRNNGDKRNGIPLIVRLADQLKNRFADRFNLVQHSIYKICFFHLIAPQPQCFRLDKETGIHCVY